MNIEKARKEGKTHGKPPPPKQNASKKKENASRKVVAKQLCPSLHKDLTIVQVCAH